ncbi:Helix-turn-helix domain-containing protein [Paenibacillus sp. UNCCL117]|uniref:AraC family transcriptional regulator n=1 Tax=unclassified Paenibacillus TaxID=185978 RepID=UPI00087FD1A5|nr:MULTISPECIES: helix-turn-helix domain-containing protein [unclassified Paenibacillus]SDD48104.1 Helix-turn-helix domain-containing protein [Paenibacillus sp. cl123]SFW50316.1 Helix-turn-helix domain-containing protein [Paenibacillus sp. UNCCL117]
MLTFIGRKQRRTMFSYANLFLSFAVIVLAANIILSSSMHMSYERHAVDLVQTYTVEELSQISYSTSFMFEAAKLTLLQLYANPAVLKLMNYSDLGELEVASLLQQIGVVHINMPLVNSIYMYNKQANRIYFDGKAFTLESFPDQDIVGKLQTKGEVVNLHPMARRIPAPGNYTSPSIDLSLTDDVYTFVFYDGHADKIDGAIVLNVSQEWMKNTIKSMNPESSGETIITDAAGRIALSNDRYGYLEDLNAYAELRDILRDGQPSGYAVRMIDGEKYVISYVSSKLHDWKFIRFTPYEAVSGKLQRILWTTIVIFLLVTVCSVLAVLWISKAVYGLFNRKLRELETKYDAEKHAGFEKKQQYLRMLTTRKLDDSVHRKRFARFHIPFKLENGFMIVMLRIDRYDEYCSRYSLEDRALLAYGFINMIGELAGPLFRHEAVDLGGGSIAVIFNLDDEDDETLTVRMEGLAREIQDKIAHYLRVSLSVSIGDRLEEISDIPDSMALCAEALEYKLFHGPRAVLYASGVKEMRKREYVFPEQICAELLDQLLAGNREAAYACSRSIVESARGYSLTSLQTAVLQMAVSLKESLKKYNIFADEISYVPFLDMASRISSYETLEEIGDKLEGLLSDIFGVLSRSLETVKRHERYSDILDQVDRFLEQEYASPSLSPEMIADHLGISAKYLRSLYKKASGESLGESINRYRMDRAKSLLEQTEASVQEVALRSGFANINYFYTLFKKYNGITPNEFRSLKLAEEP